MGDVDRFLKRRGKRWHYVRRLPVDVAHHYAGNIIQRSLKTDDLAEARVLRNAHEAADESYWQSLRLDGQTAEAAERRYEAAVKKAEAMRYKYREVSDLIAADNLEDMLQRLADVRKSGGDKQTADALIGRVEQPEITLQKVFKKIQIEVHADYLARKDEEGRKDWLNGKQRSIDLFVSLYGDLPIDQIDRDIGRKFNKYWMDRITAKDGGVTGGYANRHLGNLRAMLNDYWKLIGEDHENPFGGFSFANKRKSKRKSFTETEIKSLFLSEGKFCELNKEARLIILMMVETGARLSEIATLRAEDFILDHEYPHCQVQERDGRSVKTDNSNRIVPLVGVALAVATIAVDQDGFPHYRSRRKGLSTAVNKFFREHKFFPPDSGKSAYSLRHSYEDRMKEADIDVEMRKYLLGHAIDRQVYGEFASIKKKWEIAKKIELPYDPIVLGDSGKKLRQDR